MSTQATAPLEKLKVASLDLETTGLAPATDRIVQIGVADPWKKGTTLDVLVNPGVPIPPKTTAVHGISDDMVEKAEGIAQHLPVLRGMLESRVVLGYNIGFDLAVLNAEAARHGLEWQWNTALCVRQLAVVALGNDAMIMIGDLEGLADYYGIGIDGRHTALGDAIATGKVYRAMLPDLQKKGVSTLGDALRACSELEGIRLSTTRAGWVDVAGLGHQPTKAIERIDPYPYRHRIGEIMLAKPEIMPKTAKVQAAAAAMQKRKLDCVFIGTGPDKVEGIISERDLVHTMALTTKRAGHARALPLGKIMSSPIITVTEDDFMHVALGRISRLDIRHLGVVSDDGKLVGWISSRELVRQRVTGAMMIGDQIAAATSSKDIADALKTLPTLSNSLLADGVDGHLIAAVISGEYRNALSRAAILAEAMMKGPPPRPYTVLVLGSAGRGESLLAADQDHAIVYADGEKGGKEARAWFKTLGGHISDILDEAGIPYCKGGVMSKNDKWCRSLSGWRKAIGKWVRNATPEDVLSVDIFFDAQPVHGDMSLAAELRKAMADRSTRNADFLKLLAGSAAEANKGTTLLGGLRTEEGRFNMKTYVLLPLVETLRVLSISRGVIYRSSARRAESLRQGKKVPPEVPLLAEDIHLALKLVLRQQIKDISAGLPPTTLVEPETMTKDEQRLLKSVLGRVGILDSLLQGALFS